MLISMFYRRMLHSKYSQMFVPLFQQWEKDVMKVEQEEESFVVGVGLNFVINLL